MFTVKLPFMILDEVAIQKALNNWATDLLYKAAAHALKVMAKDFPVETGMAVSTLKPLARAVRTVLSHAPPKSSRVESDYVRHTISGELRGQKIKIIADLSHYEIHWSTDVLHYVISETYHVQDHPQTPWNTWVKGYNAFYNYLRANWKISLPNLRVFLRKL